MVNDLATGTDHVTYISDKTRNTFKEILIEINAIFGKPSNLFSHTPATFEVLELYLGQTCGHIDNP